MEHTDSSQIEISQNNVIPNIRRRYNIERKIYNLTRDTLIQS